MRLAFLLTALLTGVLLPQARELRLIEVDPGHSHAAALHATMLPGFSREAHIYAPLGADLTAHLNRIAQFNHRGHNPTNWALNVYAGPDYLEKMQAEPPGNVVVLSGRNRNKIDYIEAALRSGQNVLADKPWIIEPEDLPRLENALNLAESKGLIAYDCMTQRFDAAYQLERKLVSDREIFGEAVPGTPDAPGVRLENLHALFKKPSLRPAWYFDIRQQGEGIADVGTHLVDLAEWTLFPDQAIDYRRDVQVLRAERWPTILSRAQFAQVTGEKAWPDYLRGAVKDEQLPYFTNSSAVFTLRGIHVGVRVRWEYEAEPGVKDSYFASYQGSKSRIELRGGAKENYVPQVYIVPAGNRELVSKLRHNYPQLTFAETENGIHAIIPHGSNSDYFSLLVDRFLRYARNPKDLPAWEKPDMIAKYYITTRAVQIARQGHP